MKIARIVGECRFKQRVDWVDSDDICWRMSFLVGWRGRWRSVGWCWSDGEDGSDGVGFDDEDGSDDFEPDGEAVLVELVLVLERYIRN